MFIDSRIFYFHLNFHCKSFCVKAVHLSLKLSLTNPRLWSTDDMCIGFYVLLLKMGCILKKNVCQYHTVLKNFLKKQRRLELKSVGNSGKTVLVESANQFSLEDQCMTQYGLKYCSTPYLPPDCLSNP